MTNEEMHLLKRYLAHCGEIEAETTTRVSSAGTRT